MVLAQHGLMGTSMQSPVDVTYLADTVILLRYFEAFGEVKQAVAVIKKRTGGHERLIREFHITSAGVEIGQPLQEFEGVLTGVPVYKGKRENLLSPSYAQLTPQWHRWRRMEKPYWCWRPPDATPR
jgi:circadian clock protein KaiC